MLNWRWLMVGAAILMAMAWEIVWNDGWIHARAHFVGASILMWITVAAKKAKYPYPVSSERQALGEIVEMLDAEHLSDLGIRIKKTAMNGLKNG